ncbi:MAG: biotin-dependent carboxyltransferase family protein [Acidobacteriota bacterium]
MDAIRIIKPGLFTTIQDRGREGYRAYGVPPSGALDRFSFYLANSLVENPWNFPAFEITLLGPKIEFLSDLAFAITGGEIEIRLNGKEVEMNQTISVKKGNFLELGFVKKGARAYLVVSGLLDIPVALGSYSTYTKGKIGGYEERQLSEGDIIKLKEIRQFVKHKEIKVNYQKNFLSPFKVDFILEKEDELIFSEYEKFLSEIWIVKPESDRSGYRLKGIEVYPFKKREILSEPLNTGTIQILKEGNPVVILADGPTIGGYPKIGTVLVSDLDKFGQMKPGDKIIFRRVSFEEAYKKREEYIRRIENIYELL